MRRGLGGAAIVIGLAVVAGVLWMSMRSVSSQSDTYVPPRSPYGDGKPDLSGIWQAMNTANWDLEGHAARSWQPQLGVIGAAPAGQSVVEGGTIPYRPEALKQKQENAANWLERDPEVKCYMPGVPRATYIPLPFQIVQTQNSILMAYEYAATSRAIPLDRKLESPVDNWMGQSNGHWEGDVLVVDVTSFTDQTWLDRAGDYHTNSLHVVERYSRIKPDVLWYEATIEDPNVYTRPWKIRMPLYRRLEPNAQLMEFKCVEFVEEMLYGKFKRPSTE